MDQSEIDNVLPPTDFSGRRYHLDATARSGFMVPSSPDEHYPYRLCRPSCHLPSNRLTLLPLEHMVALVTETSRSHEAGILFYFFDRSQQESPTFLALIRK
jgi:hypothetical protein